MAFLFLLTESEGDDLFYEACAERVTQRKFELMSRRLRKGAGLGAVRSSLQLLIADIQRTGQVDDTFFLVALDNDRAPQFPDDARPPGNLPQKDRRKPNRYRETLKQIEATLGPDRARWPIKGALAVPVEMLESWILLICDPQLTQSALPIFAESTQASARNYHAGSPPPQLKDLVAAAVTRGHHPSKADLLLHCALTLDPQSLATRSRSFALLLADLTTW